MHAEIREEEKRIMAKVAPYYKGHRLETWKHVRRVVKHGKKILYHEEGDPAIVIPALWFHDIGWVGLSFSDRKDRLAHLKKGQLLTETILEDIGFGKGRVKKISLIVSIHSLEKEIHSLKGQIRASGIIVFEADRLDRFGLDGLNWIAGRAKVTGEPLKELLAIRNQSISKWFQTNTSKKLLSNLLDEEKASKLTTTT